MTPGYQPFLPRGSLKIFSLYNTHLLWLLENNHLLFPRKHYAKLSKTPYKKKKNWQNVCYWNYGRLPWQDKLHLLPGFLLFTGNNCFEDNTVFVVSKSSHLTFSNTGKIGLPFRPLELLQFSKNCNSSILNFNGLECVKQLFKNTLGWKSTSISDLIVVADA